MVREHEDGSVEVYYRGERIGFHEIAESIREVAQLRHAATGRIRAKSRAKPDHPWPLGL